MEEGKVLVLTTPATISKSAKFVIHFGVPAVGLAYVAGSLKRNNIPYQLVDGLGEDINRLRPCKTNKELLIVGLSFEELVARIKGNPRYICIGSYYSPAWYAQTDIIRRLRKLYPDSIFILGGENATAYWDKILKYEDSIDVCILGEADDILINLLDAYETGKDLKTIDGIAYRNAAGEVIKNPRAKRIRDISKYYPDWDQIPLENYLSNKKAVRNYGKRTIPMVASRGCPYQCTFCNSADKWGPIQITRPPEDVVAEMKYYKEKYNVEHICVVDLASTASGKWFLKLCQLLVEANLGITWEMSSGTRSELLSYENLKLVKASGNIHLSLSPESGSKRTLKDINKRIDLDHFEQVVKDCFKLGIRIKCNFVTGMQHQKIKDINETYLAALKYTWFGSDDITLFSYVAFPGTEMHNSMLKTGELSINNREEYEKFNYDLASCSIVAVKKQSIVEKNYPIHILNVVVMLSCFALSVIRKPSRLAHLIWSILTRNAIGVFEVAAYSGLVWPFVMARMHFLNFLEKFGKKPLLVSQSLASRGREAPQRRAS